ncbi:tyrosine-type recombinase/integrase [Bradyrhizobium centrosematis]|uniref:tyrosine-type recombinase/integrase n=1 Tax=Bradyrhizobium centrosematis TaxID=1300039 RepID=UPI00389116C8
MPVVKLTQSFVDKLRAPHPSGKQVLYLDTVTKGFGVQVSGSTAAIDYIAQRDLPNKIKGARKQTRRVNIGPVNSKVVTLEVARERAEEELDKIRRGIDPKAKAEPGPEATMFTLRQTKERYYLAKKNLSKGSKHVYDQIEAHLADWMDQPLASITKDMVEQRHAKIAADIAREGRYEGRATANGVMVTLRVLWRWAAKRIALPPCPVGRLEEDKAWFHVAARTTRVAPDQLPAFYRAVSAEADLSPVQRDFLLMLLFTGFRKTETARLKWTAIDLRQRAITLIAPDTKSKKRVEIPMSQFVYELLVKRRGLTGNDEYVFPGYRAGRPLSDTQLPLRKVKKATGITVSAHSLRRTFLKTGAAARVNLVYLKALANHSLGRDVTSEHYIAPELEDLREPAQQVCDKMLELCNVPRMLSGNVAKLRQSFLSGG